MSLWRARFRDRAPALVLVGVGLAALYHASKLSFGTVHQPGSGFYPTVVCALLILCGAVALGGRTASMRAEEPVEAGGHARIWLVVGALAAYTWALPKVGFVICTVALLLLLLRGIGRISWTGSAAAAGISAVACYGAFVKLGLPLPAGWLAF